MNGEERDCEHGERERREVMRSEKLDADNGSASVLDVLDPLRDFVDFLFRNAALRASAAIEARENHFVISRTKNSAAAMSETAIARMKPPRSAMSFMLRPPAWRVMLLSVQRDGDEVRRG